MTEIMASSPQNKVEEATISCLLRRSLVKATPEERVRQELLFRLVTLLGYPASLIVIEKNIAELPNRSSLLPPPRRRVDLVIYHPSGFPLMLIECKACAFTKGAIRQVLGYNAFIAAPCVALVNAVDTLCFVRGEQVDTIPSWEMVLKI